MKVKVIIEETISQTFEVEVSDMDNAYTEIKNKYCNNELVLDNAHIVETNVAFLDESGEAGDFNTLY